MHFWNHATLFFSQSLANTFCKGPDSKQLRLCRLQGRCYNSTLLVDGMSLRQHAQEQTCPGFKKTLLKMGDGSERGPLAKFAKPCQTPTWVFISECL